jgi:hypothetical protein
MTNNHGGIMKLKLLMTISLFMLVSATYSKVSEARTPTPSSVSVAGDTIVIHIPPHTYEIVRLLPEGYFPTFLNELDKGFDCETVTPPTRACQICVDASNEYRIKEAILEQYLRTANPIDPEKVKEMVDKLNELARAFNKNNCPETLGKDE